MPKTIDDTTLLTLRRHDRDKDDSLIREFEMGIETLFTSPGYDLQFWRDVELYGVREAILYVKNGNHGDWEAIQKEWDNVKVRLSPPITRKSAIFP